MNTDRYTFNHLKIVTTVFGIYLFSHFFYLIFYAQELFSNAGMLPAHLSPTYGYFPNVLNWSAYPAFATILVIALTCLSTLVIFGVERKWLFIILWFGWACLLNRNPLIRNPGLPYVGWMLLAFAVIFPIKDSVKFRLDKWIYYAAWGLLAVGYTLSGLDKLQAVSWLNGTAITHLLENPLARDYWPTHFLISQKWIHPLLTYSSLALETLFLPLALWRKTRPWIWLSLVGMQIGILFVIDFADLTFGMMMIHLFTFDPSWIPGRVKKGAVVFFDGVCGLCNSSVDFLIQEDAAADLRFSPLQGEAVKKICPEFNSQKLDTLYVWTGEHLIAKSEAWLWLMTRLGGLWPILALPFRLLPLSLLDAGYDFIARRRYKLFGKRETCRLPTSAERNLFLD